MPETFKCPSCSAPLEFEGTTFQKCVFCGSSVIVPSETFHRAGTASFGDFDFASVTGKALKIAEIQREIERGRKIHAIKIFHETFGVGLKEAKDAVEAMERGEGIDVSGMRVQTTKPPVKLDLRANPQILEAAKKIGYTVGGSILVTTIIIIVFTLGIIGAAVAVIFYAVDSAVEESKSSQTAPASEAAVASETARFGGEGTGAGKFTDNRAIAVDGTGRIYSGNYSGGRIQVFDENGRFLNQWVADPQMNLAAMAADRRGNIYIGQSRGLFVYDGETGKLLRKSEAGRTRGVFVTYDEKIVAAIGRSIRIFDSDLNIITEIKDAAELGGSSFGFEHIAVDGNGVIYAADSTSDTICKFSPEGKFIDRFKTGIRSANGLAFSNGGHLYVSDTNRIHIFDEDGKELGSFKTTQAFGLVFNVNDDLFIASRPFIVKYKINSDLLKK